ncbi:MAG: tRNA dihydrouridine synthase DusB [Desulfuromonadales bacterium]
MKIANLTLANNIILAPMAGISDLPYRRVMKEAGASLVTTEMISARGLLHEGKRTFELLRTCDEEQPLAAQIFGGEASSLAEAARIVSPHAGVIDVNMGCPVKKVIRGGAGAALMQAPSMVGQIVSAVRKATDRPLTVKIRSGWDSSSVNFLEIARIAVDEGADAVTLHPRTRSQGFSGQADWDQITQLKSALTVPVIGSGDIFTAEDGLRMLEQTACDAIMIGRGGYGNPWLIRDIAALQKGEQLPHPEPVDRLAAAMRHLEYFLEYFGEHKALFHMRKHLCWYSRGLPGAAAFRATVNCTGSLDVLRGEMECFFLSAPIEENIA